MSIIPDRRASDQAMDPEKRPADAADSDPTEPEKRVRLTPDPKLPTWVHLDPIVTVSRGGFMKNIIEAGDLDSDEETLLIYEAHSWNQRKELLSSIHSKPKLKMSQEPEPEILKKAGHSLIHISDKDSHVAGDDSTQVIQEKPQVAGDDSTQIIREKPQVAGDDSTQIIQEKPQVPGECATPIIQEKPEDVVGDFPTENDTKMLVYCFRCKKDTDHIPARCPSRPKYPNYCMVCNKKSDHLTSDCPYATEDLLKKLAYCMLCDKNTDHDTFSCPDKEAGFVWYNGAYLPNVCDLCNKLGHLGEECLLDFDDDLHYDPPGSDEDW